MTGKNDVNEEMDDSMEQFAAEVARPLRNPVHITEGFQGRTVAAIRREVGSPAASLFRPKMIQLTPMRAMLAAAVLAAVAFGGAAIGRGSALKNASVASGANPTAAPAMVRDTVHVVRFQLSAPGAHRVALVGDFNDWTRNAITLQPAGKPGVWTASVPLTAGRHEYAFIIDGKRWVADPYAVTHRDEYDVESSVIRVGETGA